VGLIENDIAMQPGWFRRLMNLFDLAAADGIVCNYVRPERHNAGLVLRRSASPMAPHL